MTRIGLPLGEEGRGRATNGHIFKRCHSSYTNGGSLIVLKLYAHAREGTNRREGNVATNHGKTQHQNTQNENTKSPPWVRSQSFIRSLYLCQYLYHYVRYLSSNVEIFCVRYLLHMSIFTSVSGFCDLYVYICLGGAALASIIVLFADRTDHDKLKANTRISKLKSGPAQLRKTVCLRSLAGGIGWLRPLLF